VQRGCDGMDIVLRKEDDDLVKKCMEYVVEGFRPREDQRGPGEK